MDTLEVLMKARAEVEKGWCKYHSEDGHGNVCAMGGIRRVTGSYHDGDGLVAVRALSGVVGDLIVPDYNDDPSTTKADVLALFDRAIAAEAVKASPDPAHVHAVA
jgi:hypothetical protein